MNILIKIVKHSRCKIHKHAHPTTALPAPERLEPPRSATADRKWRARAAISCLLPPKHCQNPNNRVMPESCIDLQHQEEFKPSFKCILWWCKSWPRRNSRYVGMLSIQNSTITLTLEVTRAEHIRNSYMTPWEHLFRFWKSFEKINGWVLNYFWQSRVIFSLSVKVTGQLSPQMVLPLIPWLTGPGVCRKSIEHCYGEVCQ